MTTLKHHRAVRVHADFAVDDLLRFPQRISSNLYQELNLEYSSFNRFQIEKSSTMCVFWEIFRMLIHGMSDASTNKIYFEIRTKTLSETVQTPFRDNKDQQHTIETRKANSTCLSKRFMTSISALRCNSNVSAFFIAMCNRNRRSETSSSCSSRLRCSTVHSAFRSSLKFKHSI